MNEFKVHRLNEAGLTKCDNVATLFEGLLLALDLPQGRERALVVTDLQRACHFAKLAIAMQTENQQ